jgi:hypothetical protein
VLLIGLFFGRWWRIAIPVAIIGWPILLMASGVDSGVRFAIDAGLVAGGNVAVGVLVNRLVARIGRAAAAS